MAEMANFPAAVVAMAKEKAAELEEFQEPAGGEGEEPDAKRRRVEKQVEAGTQALSLTSEAGRGRDTDFITDQ